MASTGPANSPALIRCPRAVLRWGYLPRFQAIEAPFTGTGQLILPEGEGCQRDALTGVTASWCSWTWVKLRTLSSLMLWLPQTESIRLIFHSVKDDISVDPRAVIWACPEISPAATNRLSARRGLSAGALTCTNARIRPLQSRPAAAAMRPARPPGEPKRLVAGVAERVRATTSTRTNPCLPTHSRSSEATSAGQRSAR